MTFTLGHKPKHDVRSAGRKGARNSPWRKGFSPNGVLKQMKFKGKKGKSCT